jgi:hypothetical protein
MNRSWSWIGAVLNSLWKWLKSKVLDFQKINFKTQPKVLSKKKKKKVEIECKGSFQNQEPNNTGWEVIKSYIQSEEWY